MPAVWLARVCIFIALGPTALHPLFARTSFALQIEPSLGVSQLDESSFHMVSYRLAIGFELDPTSRISAHIGSTHPYQAHQYSQLILRAGVTYDWHMLVASPLSLSLGLGGGVYADRVAYDSNAQSSLVPSVVLMAGFRVGGPRLAWVIQLDDYSGIYSLSSLPWVVWSHYSFTTGVSFGL